MKVRLNSIFTKAAHFFRLGTVFYLVDISYFFPPWEPFFSL